jgi:hypothetical protein
VIRSCFHYFLEYLGRWAVILGHIKYNKKIRAQVVTNISNNKEEDTNNLVILDNFQRDKKTMSPALDLRLFGGVTRSSFEFALP